MKLVKLIDPRLTELVNALAAQKLPLRTAFKLKGIVTTVKAEQIKYEEVRMESLRKYADKDENGDMVVIQGNAALSPEGGQEFAKQLTELGNTDVQVGSVSISDLGDKVELTAEDLIVLDELITED